MESSDKNKGEQSTVQGVAASINTWSKGRVVSIVVMVMIALFGSLLATQTINPADAFPGINHGITFVQTYNPRTTTAQVRANYRLNGSSVSSVSYESVTVNSSSKCTRNNNTFTSGRNPVNPTYKTGRTRILTSGDINRYICFRAKVEGSSLYVYKAHYVTAFGPQELNIDQNRNLFTATFTINGVDLTTAEGTVIQSTISSTSAGCSTAFTSTVPAVASNRRTGSIRTVGRNDINKFICFRAKAKGHTAYKAVSSRVSSWGDDEIDLYLGQIGGFVQGVVTINDQFISLHQWKDVTVHAPVGYQESSSQCVSNAFGSYSHYRLSYQDGYFKRTINDQSLLVGKWFCFRAKLGSNPWVYKSIRIEAWEDNDDDRSQRQSGSDDSSNSGSSGSTSAKTEKLDIVFSSPKTYTATYTVDGVDKSEALGAIISHVIVNASSDCKATAFSGSVQHNRRYVAPISDFNKFICFRVNNTSTSHIYKSHFIRSHGPQTLTITPGDKYTATFTINGVDLTTTEGTVIESVVIQPNTTCAAAAFSGSKTSGRESIPIRQNGVVDNNYVSLSVCFRARARGHQAYKYASQAIQGTNGGAGQTQQTPSEGVVITTFYHPKTYTAAYTMRNSTPFAQQPVISHVIVATKSECAAAAFSGSPVISNTYVALPKDFNKFVCFRANIATGGYVYSDSPTFIKAHGPQTLTITPGDKYTATFTINGVDLTTTEGTVIESVVIKQTGICGEAAFSGSKTSGRESIRFRQNGVVDDDYIDSSVCFRARARSHKTYQYASRAIQGTNGGAGQTQQIPSVVLTIEQERIEGRGLVARAYVTVDGVDKTNEALFYSTVVASSSCDKSTFSGNNVAVAGKERVVDSSSTDKYICFRATLDQGQSFVYKNQRIVSQGILPPNWDELSLEEKIALNPYGCIDTTKIRADNGQCLDGNQGNTGNSPQDGLTVTQNLATVKATFIDNGQDVTKTATIHYVLLQDANNCKPDSFLSESGYTITKGYQFTANEEDVGKHACFRATTTDEQNYILDSLQIIALTDTGILDEGPGVFQLTGLVLVIGAVLGTVRILMVRKHYNNR